MTSASLTCSLIWPRPPLAATPREPDVVKAAAQRISFSAPPTRAPWQPPLARPSQAAILFGYPACCAKSWADYLQRGGSDPLAGMLARGDKAVVPAYIALAVLGLGPIRHAPCSASCSATRDRSREFIDLGRELGFVEEMSWLEEIADWAVGASLVNGIAEVTTAAFRCTWLSDEGAPPRHGTAATRPGKREGAAAATVKPADSADILTELG